MTFPISKEITLPQLLEYKNKATEMEEYDESVGELISLADNLIKGKVDQAARFREGLKAHIEALNEQVSYFSNLLETTESLMRQAIANSGQTRIDGTAWSIRLQKNSRASIEIVNDKVIPTTFKKVSVSSSFGYSDEDFLFYASALLKKVVSFKTDLTEDEEKMASPFYRLDVTQEERAILEGKMRIDVSKSQIESYLKENKDAVLDGVIVERGSHLRVEKGKAKLADSKTIETEAKAKLQ